MAGLELNHQIYDLFINAIIPAIFLAVTNGIIFTFVRRSTQRVQPGHNENAAERHTFSRRDIRLLKHIFFMLMTFFVSWIPIYVIAVINWNALSLSRIEYQGVLMVPAIGFGVNAISLFLYNNELRTYFIDKIRRRPNQ